MRSHAAAGELPLFQPKIRRREVRDPYDGLRPWSALTHGLGAVLALIGAAALLFRAAGRGDWKAFWLFSVYGLSMVCLYTASALYHSLNTSRATRLALRKYDHCSIYLLIAGSYTPICLTALEGHGGGALLGSVWGMAGAGMILTLTRLTIPRWLSSAIYLFMGWLALFAIVPLHRTLPPEGFAWLLAGGGMYTVGGVLYAVKWPGRHNPRFGCHEIFHMFVLLGSACHFVLMYQTIAFL